MIIKKLIAGLTLGIALSFQFTFAQTPPKNWFNLDPTMDKVDGVSTERTYNELLKGKTSKTVVVAVIDIGVDTGHEDLKGRIWTNTKEVAGNNVDDDHNGYVDDVHGWDFIGGKNGDVNQDNLELTRQYRELKKKYDNVDEKTLTGDAKKDYKKYLLIKKDFEKQLADAKFKQAYYTSLLDDITVLGTEIGKDSINSTVLDKYTPNDKKAAMGKYVVTTYFLKPNETISLKEAEEDLKQGADRFGDELKYDLNVDFDPRTIVGDNYTDASEKNYGNNDVKGPDPFHGTHVSGIIAAVRNNGIGMDGIADNVLIMPIRVVPNGDERDKDVANGIRYAVDNGAKVVNMSFGKGYSYNKKAVDDAVKYAMAHDVLLVHAAGNDNNNNDKTGNYPNKNFADGGKATNWIEVGASTSDGNAASFSNYGKKNVDLFAPGVDIYSTIPNNKYKNEQGTSMASPVVAGVATVIREYFPQLTAQQVKAILLKSVTKITTKTPMPGSDGKKVKFKKLCRSGGIVNLYKAVELAEKETAK